jgi:hypothetical protein
MNVVGELRVEGPLDLTLGKEVRLAIAPSEVLGSAMRIEVGGNVYIAPLGPARIPGTSLSIEQGEGRWVEIVGTEQSPPVIGDSTCAPRTTMLLGDAFSTERGGDVVVRVGSA